MFCGPETVDDVSRGEAEGNIDSRGSTSHTAFPRSQSIFYYIPKVKETKKQSELHTKINEMFC